MIWNLISHPKAFDVLILVLFAGASVRAIVAGNPGKAVYWGSACILNIAVVFMMEGGK